MSRSKATKARLSTGARQKTRRRLNLEVLEDRRLLSGTRIDDPRAIVGDVHAAKQVPGEALVVYTADGQVDRRNELYLSDLANDTVTKLSDPLLHGSVLEFDVSASVAVYTADNENSVGLYAASIAGEGVTALLTSETAGAGDDAILDGQDPVAIDFVHVGDTVLVRVVRQDGEEALVTMSIADATFALLSATRPVVDFDTNGDFVGYTVSADDGTREVNVIPVAGGIPRTIMSGLPEDRGRIAVGAEGMFHFNDTGFDYTPSIQVTARPSWLRLAAN